MILATSEPAPYLTRVSDGRHEMFTDTSESHGGAEAGFSPHDLLEAALASCVSMTLRIYAERHQIPLEGAAVRVTLDKSLPEAVVYRYEVSLHGESLSEAQREKLLQIAQACPVRKTLSRPVRFESTAPVIA